MGITGTSGSSASAVVAKANEAIMTIAMISDRMRLLDLVDFITESTHFLLEMF